MNSVLNFKRYPDFAIRFTAVFSKNKLRQPNQVLASRKSEPNSAKLSRSQNLHEHAPLLGELQLDQQSAHI